MGWTQRRFSVLAWLKRHKNVPTDYSNGVSHYVLGEAIYRYYADTYIGKGHLLIKVEFCRALSSIGIRSKYTRWGTEYQMEEYFDIPDSYISAVNQEIAGKKRLYNEKRRK